MAVRQGDLSGKNGGVRNTTEHPAVLEKNTVLADSYVDVAARLVRTTAKKRSASVSVTVIAMNAEGKVEAWVERRSRTKPIESRFELISVEPFVALPEVAFSDASLQQTDPSDTLEDLRTAMRIGGRAAVIDANLARNRQLIDELVGTDARDE